jgi:iron complex transport system ATP-binding protein
LSLRVDHLSFGFHGIKALDDIFFEVDYGNLACLLGCNGAGKSTLFRCILGLLPYQQGNIFVDDTDISSLSIKDRAKKIAYIPQGLSGDCYYVALDLVLMGTSSQLGHFSSPGKIQITRAYEALEMLDIAYLAKRCYAHLSGGERQLVLIARAIAQQTKILIMDEPCASLDYGNQIMVMDEIKKLAKQNYLMLMSTHNPEHALLYADETLVLLDKKIECFHSPCEIMNASLIERIYGVPVVIYEVGGIPVCIPRNHALKGKGYVGTV